eukprot:5959137-Ditylum_brightwellii.AAC.1
MDVFCSLKLSTLTLEWLNAVRLYLGALTLSDIVTDNGTSIADWALTGRRIAKVPQRVLFLKYPKKSQTS